MSEKPIVPDYVAAGSDLVPRDRWSWSAIASLVFSLVSSPLILWRILTIKAVHDLLRSHSGRFPADGLLETFTPILSLFFAIAVSIRIARSEHLRGMAFTIPAIIISLPGCALESLFLFISIAGIRTGPQ